ncbi:hypothetical protein XPA_008500 [Xanthoria parietina]
MSGHITQGFFTLVRSDPEKPPPLLKYRSSKGFILTTICVAVFTDIFLYGIIVPVVPFALTKRAGVAEEDVQHWVSVLLAVYGAALLASAPVCGFLADRSTSRRLPLLVGLLALAGATLLLCFGHTIAVLVTGRLLQGISAAIVWTVGLALLVDTVGQKEIGQVMGYISISMSVSILVAPLLGGVVYDRGGYFGVYYMAFALIIVDIILRTVMIEKKVACKWEKQDQATVVSGSSEREKATSSGQQQDSWLPNQDSVLHLTLSENKVAKRWDSGDGLRPEAPLPTDNGSVAPESKRISPTSNATTIVEEPEPSPDSNTPPECPSPVESSSAATPKEARTRPPVVVLLSSRRLLSALYSSSLLWWERSRTGTDHDCRHRLAFSSPRRFLVLLRLVSHGGRAQVVILCVLLACLGVALTIVMTPLLAEVAYILEAKEQHHPGLFGQKGAYAQAYGLFNMAFAGGMLVGPLWAGAVVDKQGWGTMCLTLGILSVVSAIPAFLFTNGWIGEQWKRGKKGEDQGVDVHRGIV